MDSHKIQLDILPQPDLTTCGPTSLHAIYRFYGEEIPLQRVIDEVKMLDGGGTLAVLLALHALRRGYRALIYTYNLFLFDPSWFDVDGEVQVDLVAKLHAQARIKCNDPRLQAATEGYVEFVRLGGRVRFLDLTPRLLRRYLQFNIPIVTGLSSTYLYHEPRELPDCTPDDLAGHTAGHFAVLCGYNRIEREVYVADPLTPNRYSPDHYYAVPMERLIGAILLGIVTYDANLLIIEPREATKGNRPHGDLFRR